MRSLGVFWRSLPSVDCVWLLGPNPLAICFALLAALRGKRVILGVRQDTLAYVRSRHPGKRGLEAAGLLLEGIWRSLARAFAVIAVGADLGHRYSRSRALLEIAVSLVDDADLVPPDEALARPRAGRPRVLSVGRLETEKNPLLLADALALLNRDGGRWELLVCGEGSMREALESRLRGLGEAGAARLVGYVAFGPELMQAYRSSSVLLQNSWTEGLPQVVLEAFAAGLPVVASDVGGIGASAPGAVELVPAGDPDAAARAIERVEADGALRERLVRAGHEYVRTRTADAEALRVARFLAGDPSLVR